MISITINDESVEAVRSQMRMLIGDPAPAAGQSNAGNIVGAVDRGEAKEVKRPSGKARTAAAEKAEAADRQISTNPEDRKETEVDKADAADEKADGNLRVEPGQEGMKQKEVAPDDVRNALGDYVRKFGMAAAQEDGLKVIGIVMGALKIEMPKGAAGWTVSAIPENQETLRAVIEGIVEMTEKNPFKREPVPAAK